jgi:hypothetical protein
MQERELVVMIELEPSPSTGNRVNHITIAIFAGAPSHQIAASIQLSISTGLDIINKGANIENTLTSFSAKVRGGARHAWCGLAIHIRNDILRNPALASKLTKNTDAKSWICHSSNVMPGQRKIRRVYIRFLGAKSTENDLFSIKF